MMEYKYVVLGSGFGAATVALRLAEAGEPVLVLERGQRFRGKNLKLKSGERLSQTFPEPGDKHFFWSRQILRPWRARLGLFQLRQFRQLQGLVAAGVGGGSLIWANVVVQAHEKAFKSGWPAGLELSSLQPYYERARNYLRPALAPGVQTGAFPRALLHKIAAERIGKPWSPVELAVNFADPDIVSANGFGNARQKGCNFCGLCSSGCPQNAKNTVDLTYLAAAEAKGIDLRPLHEVHAIEASGNAYVLHVRRYDADGAVAERLRIQAENVVVACGVFGTVELLLRSRALGLLPNLSGALGAKFSINGNVLSGALATSSGEGKAFRDGPSIASMIDFGDHVVEDFADPSVWAQGMVGGSEFSRAYGFLRAYLGLKKNPEQLASLAKDLLVYVGVGMDSAGGRLRLSPFGGLSLDWPGLASEPAIQAQHRAQRRIAEALGRKYVPDVFSTFSRQFTYHPLGGCPMSDNSHTGVVDSLGRVYGHKRLYVADASIIPTALGRNPAFTVCALAERVAEGMLNCA